jgi:hypothetical protein
VILHSGRRFLFFRDSTLNGLNKEGKKKGKNKQNFSKKEKKLKQQKQQRMLPCYFLLISEIIVSEGCSAYTGKCGYSDNILVISNVCS